MHTKQWRHGGESNNASQIPVAQSSASFHYGPGRGLYGELKALGNPAVPSDMLVVHAGMSHITG